MPDLNLENEIARRRTFAIISHPDAGKTTLTEKLLLCGAAIREAGAIKKRKGKSFAVSDWMEIERQRGISVTSSVMSFEFNGYRINILDTPGHQDFSEDTYRTLIAADSAIMLIDAAKGVEEQTKKLFRVCRMRGIPIFTFINKIDRHCKNPIELLDELEETLGIASCPVTWPVGAYGEYSGVYNRQLKQIELFNRLHTSGAEKFTVESLDINDTKLEQRIGNEASSILREELSLLNAAGEPFDLDRIRRGELTPVFFGSAVKDFGVKSFLEDFIAMAPAPAEKNTTEGTLMPQSQDFSGFVFKIQANMDPKHRDRLAFIRVCSGKYEKDMSIYNARLGKEVRLPLPQQFMGQDRSFVDDVYAGDIIGVFDTGSLHIGDTLCDAKNPFHFDPIPMFPAEHFSILGAGDASKRKQFIKGIEQLVSEGAVQIFRNPDFGTERYITGVAGSLQLDVLKYRLLLEYGVDVKIEPLKYRLARWIQPQNTKLKLPQYFDETMCVVDAYGRLVVLFENEWTLKKVREENAKTEFLDIAP